MSIRVPALLLLFVCCAAAQKKPITIDVLTHHPRTRELGASPVWAPDGARFVYKKGDNIMLYDVPSKSEKQLASISELSKTAHKSPEEGAFDWQNRRVSEADFTWAASGKELLISAEGDLFLWHIDSAKSEQITATPDPERDAKLSPDGKFVAFRRAHDLYAIELATHKETRLTSNGSPVLLNGELDWVYPEELDLGTAFWWAPDSKHIAYLQFDTSHEFVYPQIDLRNLRAVAEPERYPQAGTPNANVRLGVVAPGGGETRWMDLGENHDVLIARVYWTPDSNALAIERLNRVQNQLDLLVSRIADGSSRVLLHESDPCWINTRDHLRFVRDGREFLWFSERDGFNHLYRYSMDGKELGRVTRGDWEVESVVGVDEKRDTIYYVSSETSPLERQLYSARFDGSQHTQITHTAGTHSISMSPATDYFLDTFSSSTEPPRRTLHTRDGAEWTVFRAADRTLADEYEVLPAENVTVKASDGTPLYAHLIKPANFKAGTKYPAIVMVYGGPGAQSVRNYWQGASWEQVLAQRGFVVWQIDNRGSTGRGHKFETPIYHRFGKIELEDQRAGINYLVSQGFVDPTRIGIYGWSYGGYMTLYSLLNAPDVFKAGVAGAPVTDWHNYDTIYTERYLGVPSGNEEGYRASSAVTYADKLQGKLLIVHNIEDDNVLFQNTLQMSDALEKAGKFFSTVIYPQKTHGVTGPAYRQFLEEATSFFEANLK